MATQVDTGNAYVYGLLAYLHSLSSSANPFSSTLTWLLGKVSPPALPDWYCHLAIAFACLFALQSVLLAASTVILLAGPRSWVFRWTPEGFWQTNPKITIAFFGAVFSGCQTAALIRQILICEGRVNQRNQIAVQGLRWVPIQIAAWLFAHASLCNIVVKGRRLGATATSSASNLPMSTLRSRSLSAWRVWAMNILGAALPAAATAGVCVSFTLSNVHQNMLVDRISALTLRLAAAATAYDPAKVPAEDLAPFFSPIIGVESAHSAMVLWWRIGVGLLAAFMLLISVVFLPFFIRHLALLRRLMGAQPLWRAIKLDFESVPARLSAWATSFHSRREGTSSRPSALTTTDDPMVSMGINTIAGGRQSTVEDGYSAPSAYKYSGVPAPPSSLRSHHVPPDAPAPAHPFPKSCEEVEVAGRYRETQRQLDDLNVRAEYRRLLLTGSALWMGMLGYFPIAIWATATSLESLTFWKAELWLTNVPYFLTVFLVHVCFNYLPAWRQLRQRLGPELTPINA